MEKIERYEVIITANALKRLHEVMEYFHKNLSLSSASQKISDLLDKAESLNTMPNRGQREFSLVDENKIHRYLLFWYTNRKQSK